MEEEPIPAPSHASRRRTTTAHRQWPAALSSCRSRPIAPSVQAKNPARGRPATGVHRASPESPGAIGPLPPGTDGPAAAGSAAGGPAGTVPPPGPPVPTPKSRRRRRQPAVHARTAATTRPARSATRARCAVGHHPAAARPPLPGPPAPPPKARGESRSSLLIGRGGGTSSVLKPCSRAQVRASPWIPSASRIFCVAAMILLTAAPDAFAASALHRAWIAWISASFSGSGFFDARTSSISLLPSFAISCQSAPQIIDFVGSGIQGVCFCFVFLCFIELGFLALEIPGD